ncbi:MAG: 23S rRNA (uracil(1939)-C(5))-methyltransferase RlmD [Firmicutes bacterium]|nr:23S rRNA (uracil(1939)-C(5))-methyltransferase RlmD [Bacillota bacterium]
MGRTGEQIELYITDISTQGEGIGKTGGLAVFASGALPGDTVLAEITEDKGRFAKAKVLEILQPSPDRVESDCPARHGDGSSVCGGCALRELSYEAGLRWKENFVRGALQRIGGFAEPPVKPIRGMEHPYDYRNKVEFAVEKGGRIGFYAAGSHELCDYHSCLIAFPEAIAMADAFAENPVKGVKQMAFRRGSSGQTMAVIHSDKQKLTHLEDLIYALDEEAEDLTSVCWVDGPKMQVLAGAPVIEDTIITDMSTIKVEVGPQSFYQVNPSQTTVLYRLAQQYAALTGTESVLDLYCGAGSIGLSMAGHCRRVIGVESVKPAVIAANRNAVINGIVNAEFICGKAEEVVETKLQGVKADVVILDPPRAGCKPQLLETVADIAPQRIVYVSCNPATLARDLKILREKGYELKECTPVDMFPFTLGIESVSQLVRQ